MIKLIAIVEKNFGISYDETIPWSFEADRLLFRILTTGSEVIMGRNTFLSHKNFPLKNRTNIVITNSLVSLTQEVVCMSSVEEAIKQYPNAWVIGGAELYNYTLEHDLIDISIITQVNKTFEADKFLDKSLLKKFTTVYVVHQTDYTVSVLMSEKYVRNKKN